MIESGILNGCFARWEDAFLYLQDEARLKEYSRSVSSSMKAMTSIAQMISRESLIFIEAMSDDSAWIDSRSVSSLMAEIYNHGDCEW